MWGATGSLIMVTGWLSGTTSDSRSKDMRFEYPKTNFPMELNKVYCLVLYCIVLYGMVWYGMVWNGMYCIVSYRIVLHCIVLYCIVLSASGAQDKFVSVFPRPKCCADSLSVCPTPVCILMHKNDHVRTSEIL